MRKFDYRQDITFLRVTIDGLLNTFQEERLQLWMKPSGKGSRLMLNEIGEGDQALGKFAPKTMQEADLGKITFTAKEHRLSAYVLCQSRELLEVKEQLKATMAKEISERKLRFDNIQKHLDLWL